MQGKLAQFKQFTWRYPGLSPVHLTLNVLAVITWAGISAGPSILHRVRAVTTR